MVSVNFAIKLDLGTQVLVSIWCLSLNPYCMTADGGERLCMNTSQLYPFCCQYGVCLTADGSEEIMYENVSTISVLVSVWRLSDS